MNEWSVGSSNGRPRWTLTANDEPEGTVYFLADHTGRYIAMADWPQPLEQLAWERGAVAVRGASNYGEVPAHAIGLEYERVVLADPHEEAVEFLADLLAGGPVPILDIARARLKAGVKVSHLNYAAKSLGVEKHIAGRRFVVGGGASSGTRGSFGVWCLPGQWTKGWMPERSPVTDEVQIEVDEVAIPEDELTPEERVRAQLMDTIEEITDEPIDRQAVGLPERMEELPVAVVQCKVDGCLKAATGTGTFTGFCDQHKSEEASRRNRLGWERRQREGVERESADTAKGAGVVQARTKPRVSKKWKGSEQKPAPELVDQEADDAMEAAERAAMHKIADEVIALAVHNENADDEVYEVIARFDTEKDAKVAADLLVDSRDDNFYVVVRLSRKLLEL